MRIVQEYRTIAALDIEQFGRADRDDRVRVQLRRKLLDAVQRSFRAARIQRAAWTSTSTGDGLLLLVDPTVPTAKVLRTLLDRVPGVLTAWNRSATEAARVRVRAVLHAGHVMLDEQGATGEQLNLAFRLLDSEPLRGCLRLTTGPMVLGVSTDIYQQVVRHRPLELDPETFTPIRVEVKETATDAWVCVPGAPVSGLAERTGERPAISPAERAGDAGRAGSVPKPPVTPMQLPPAPVPFAARDDELRALDGLWAAGADRCRVAVITGTGGVGKTALALTWAHRAREDFPDGCLYADLQGHAPDGPVTPEAVRSRFLRALGAEPAQIPGTDEEQAALYASLTAGRRLLVVLDDGAATSQIRPLVPSSAQSLVLATSRRRLAGLLADGARLLPLDPLDSATAVELLARLVGERRVRTEPVHAKALARLCGGLPIALRVAAARLAIRPRARIAPLVESLTSEQHRLTELTIEEHPSVRGAFDSSYRALPADAARMYRLAGLHPGASFGAGVAAAAADLPPATTSDLLAALVDTSLVQDVGEDRYRLHDLVRLHARAEAERVDHVAERDAALRRMLEWYLVVADAADQAVMAHRRRPERTYRFQPPWTAPFADSTAGLTWLEAERDNLRAAVHSAAERGWHATAWQLVDAMWSLFLYHKHYHDWLDLHRTGLAAARACEDPQGEILLLNHLGLGLRGLGRHEEARDRFTEALAMSRAAGDRHGEATALSSLGSTLHAMARAGEAIPHLSRAVALQHALHDRRGEALTRVNLARLQSDSGQLELAAEQLESARAVFASLPDHYNEARALAALGRLNGRRGRLDAAVGQLESALAVMRRLGSRFEQGQILESLGDVLHEAGDNAGGRRCFRLAHAHYTAVGSSRAHRLTDGQEAPVG